MGSTRNLRNWIRAARQYRRKDLNCQTLPIRLWIEPTNFCNLKCVMCPQKDINDQQRGFMDFGLFKKIIDEASEFTSSINLFLGGEPLMHPKVMEMVNYVKKKGLKARISTNAGLLTKEKSQALLEEDLDFICFSFDGYDKETYESIRIKGNFEKTLGNIITFLELKKQMKKKKPYVVFQIIEMPAVRETSKEIRKAFFSRLNGLPVENFWLLTPHRFGGKISEQETGNSFAFTRKTTKLKYQPCPYLWTSMNILWDGRVVPCCLDFFGDYLLGDIKKESLKEIWNSQKMQDLRRSLKDKNLAEIKLCRNCDFLYQDTLLGISKKNIKDFWQFIRESTILGGGKFGIIIHCFSRL